MKNFFNKFKKSFSKVPVKRIWVTVLLILVFFGIVLVGFGAYGASYVDRILPGVRLGNRTVGGMDETEFRAYLNLRHTSLIDEGIKVRFDNRGKEEVVIVDSSIVSEDKFQEIVRLDIDSEVRHFLNYKKDGNIVVRAWNTLLSRLARPKLELEHISINGDQFQADLEGKLGEYESEARNASIRVDSISPLEYTYISSSPGVVFEYVGIEQDVITSWSSLIGPDITIKLTREEPEILQNDVEKVVDRLGVALDHGKIELEYTDPHNKKEYSWILQKETLSEWIEVQKTDTGIGFGLSASSSMKYFEDKVASSVNVEAENARFQIGENGKVSEFIGSRPGVGLDFDETYKALNDAFIGRSWHDEGLTNIVSLVIEKVEPEIKTGEVNDLGIHEVLGVGYSNYSGSPSNRIKNIRHAVRNKLNGLLIEPDEDFSLINALKPFTIEGGYLSELVIKGEKIEPEVGGGLCQIGTTMFRAAMNSGLPITERRNHSLVVSYYNDHRNGKPGTDATIYDPSPDLRFLNDTGNYILITAEMNERTGELFFTLWGTDDGREAYYTEPVVHNWIGYGPMKEVESEEMATGQRKCQGAHPGAVTSFIYVKILPDGEKVERIFESYYRPLPTICLVGPGGAGGGSEDVESSGTETVPAEGGCIFLETGEQVCN
ncbi:MAG: VanW family protein [Candidatus Magasanikbacteria bacterium]